MVNHNHALNPDQSFLSLCHRPHIAGAMYVVKFKFELESLFVQRASTCFFQSSTYTSCSIKYQGVERLKFARCFLPAHVRMWNDLPYTVFGIIIIVPADGCSQPLAASLSDVFFSFVLCFFFL